jgi:hypothetical protein
MGRADFLLLMTQRGGHLPLAMSEHMRSGVALWHSLLSLAEKENRVMFNAFGEPLLWIH